MEKAKTILQGRKFLFTLERLARQLIENHGDFRDVCLIGIQERGSLFSDRLYDILKKRVGDLQLQYGKMDITFYRDDFRMHNQPLAASKTEMDFIVENKTVILVDDVLYTGRTIRAALSALQHYGRPAKVELAVMVDRRFNRELPIHADYVGEAVDAVDKAYVEVRWKEKDKEDKIVLFPAKKNE